MPDELKPENAETQEDAPKCDAPAPAQPFRPEIRPAAEPFCCGSGCVDCPF